MNLTGAIIPYKGIEGIDLYQSISVVRQYLSAHGLKFREEVWGSSSETVPNPWTVLVLDDVMSLFFASNDKLFKIVLWKGYQGMLPNGIYPGIPLDEARTIDPLLSYDDWNEDYESPEGYWLEDDIDSKDVMSISIFIPELHDEASFDDCNW